MQLDGAVHGASGAVKMNALVRAIPAGDVAKIAADALLLVDAGDDLVIQVQVLPVGDAGERKAAKILDAVEALGAHPVFQPLGHVFDDAIAVVHDRGAHLHGAAAEQDELRRIAPVCNASNARKRESRGGIGHDLLDHVERDGLDGGAAIAAVGAFAIHVGARRQGVEIDAGDGVDGVDGRKSIGPSALGGAGHGANVGDVGRELD